PTLMHYTTLFGANAESRENRPGPKCCAANVAMRRCGTWQGNDHCLRPAPCLATFGAATRLATKRQQTLGDHHVPSDYPAHPLPRMARRPRRFPAGTAVEPATGQRSEERRVGKEGRTRRMPHEL